MRAVLFFSLKEIYVYIYIGQEKTEWKNNYDGIKYQWNASGLETHEKFLFSLIIAVRSTLALEKSHYFQKRKLLELRKQNGNLLKKLLFLRLISRFEINHLLISRLTKLH